MSISVDIKKRFKGFTLDMKFDSGGTSLGILGASGSGKSMTLKCIAGIETPDEGYIEVNGRVLFDSYKKINVKPQKRRIGYLFQSYALFPNMTVEQNIACAIDGDKAHKAQKIAGLLSSFQLSALVNRYPSQLSGGQQQRVALARILAYEPDVLLLDEPFSALDESLKESLQIDMMKLIDNYAGDTIMVTHNRDEVYKLCKNLMILDAGQVQSIGETHATFKNPSNLISAQLTGCKNFSRAKKISDNLVFAEDWDCKLVVEGTIPNSLTHIGVRAHYFTPCENEREVNAIRINACKHIESPFEWNILFEKADTKEKVEKIWWKYAKDDSIKDIPKYLSISPKNILLLESNTK